MHKSQLNEPYDIIFYEVVIFKVLKNVMERFVVTQVLSVARVEVIGLDEILTVLSIVGVQKHLSPHDTPSLKACQVVAFHGGIAS